MARIARKKSKSGIYHIMIRGNEKKDIFFDDQDRRKFLNVITKAKDECKYALYAYCIMSNHVHMLVGDCAETIDYLMKKVEISYAYYFNKKYNRVGHLFQDRFCSEAVEGDQYLLTAARYIHNNPVKAGIASNPKDYIWSSYNAYILDGLINNPSVDTNFILSLFSDDRHSATKLFIDFSNNREEDDFIDIDSSNGIEQILKDDELGKQLDNIVRKYGLKLDELSKCADRQFRNRILHDVKQHINISIRELSKISGVSKDIIYRA